MKHLTLFVPFVVVSIGGHVFSQVAASVPAAAQADDAWRTLDADVETLSTSLQQTHGFAVGGWLRSRYANSNDVMAGGNDLGGFNLDGVRVALSAQPAEGFGLNVNLEGGDPAISDASGPGMSILDAYATVKLGDYASASIGRFSVTFLWSAGFEDRRLLFLDRSFLGEATDGRDVGIELSGAIDRFNWWAAAQNGADAVGDKLALSARASYNILGDSLSSSEGCCGLGNDEHLTLGVAWFDDDSLGDGTAVAADAVFAKGGWSAIAEIVDFADDIRPAPAVNASTGIVIPVGAAVTGAETPWNASLAYMLVPDRWELAARWQDLDDDASTTIWTGAVSRYFEGHNAKCTLQFDSASSDAPGLDVNTLAIGLTVGI